MINHAARNPEKIEIYNGLVAAIHEAMPASINAEQLRRLIGSMLGHMGKLSWTEPWLVGDVINPLLKNKRATFDDACEIWIQELADLLDGNRATNPLLFDQEREGQMTNNAAYLFAFSNTDRQQASLKSMEAILKKQRRIVQQPITSTSNWTFWNDALVVSMWILAFARWGQVYLRERGMAVPTDLQKLSRAAGKLAMVRPMFEWRSNGVSIQGELAAFLDQAESLLA